MGLKAGRFAKWMLRGRRTKKWMRSAYALKSLWQLKRSSMDVAPSRDYWQAGKSVGGITSIEPAGQIVRRFAEACRQ
jgi:nitronate monooxygenase